uniref:Reverse transcriptase Ty1/copia-type domain-containing protein n=1 Tax=Nicotiana tabacum TaxID=4097 RepID=A0A1S4BQM9_TOBAC|nr:PREDICTED: uncharacterized protein LOC107810885 [Nicotiana tabacum]
MVTLRSVIAIATAKGWVLQKMNVYNAFLQGDLEEEVYIHLSRGFSHSAGAKLVGAPIEVNQKLTISEFDHQFGVENDSLLADPGAYQRLIGRLLYLKITRSDISFTKSKKQNTIAHSSAEAEYKSLASTVAEIMGLVDLFTELGISLTLPAPLYCDSK